MRASNATTHCDIRQLNHPISHQQTLLFHSWLVTGSKIRGVTNAKQPSNVSQHLSNTSIASSQRHMVDTTWKLWGMANKRCSFIDKGAYPEDATVTDYTVYLFDNGHVITFNCKKIALIKFARCSRPRQAHPSERVSLNSKAAKFLCPNQPATMSKLAWA